MRHPAPRGRDRRAAALQRIRAARQELRARLQASQQTAAGSSPPIEIMDGVQHAVASRTTAAAQRVLLARIEALQQAEERVREGTYGRCVVCGEPIPERRLEALPEARHCVPCAEAMEAGRLPRPALVG